MVSLFVLTCIPGHITFTLKTSHGSLLPASNSVASKSWPWPFQGFVFPCPLFPVCTTGSRLMEHMASSPAFSPCRCSPLGLMSSLRPHFLPVLSSFPAQLFWSPAGSPQTDILVASSFAPQCRAHISIRARVVGCLGWHLAGFLCIPPPPRSPGLRQRLCLIPFHNPCTWLPVGYRVGSLPTFE